MRLESLPNTNRLVQSDITNILVRQLTCLLIIEDKIKNGINSLICIINYLTLPNHASVYGHHPKDPCTYRLA